MPRCPVDFSQLEWAKSAEIKRWLEQSGPMYEERDLAFSWRSCDTVMLCDADDEFLFSRDQLSYASWFICCAAVCAEELKIKVRTV